MAEEPDNLVLVLLRKLDAKIDAFEERANLRFDKIEAEQRNQARVLELHTIELLALRGDVRKITEVMEIMAKVIVEKTYA